MWIHATSIEANKLDPLKYGYIMENDAMVPQITGSATIPSDFPMPCKCLKCFKITVCPCRIAGIKCCEFCKCEGCKDCRNPLNIV